ncbi:MAG: hypothetical protein Q8L88_09205 [Bacteroidota bacterium]|nr:hypothetical protein [Bacteroidota bacterium]
MIRLKLFYFLIVLFAFSVKADEKIRTSVSYISASVVYLNAGREAGFVVGDTVDIQKNQRTIATIIITAVSKKSSAAQILTGEGAISVGDMGISKKNFIAPIPAAAISIDTLKESTKTIVKSIPKSVALENNENIITGRVSLQYSGMFAEDSRFNLSQPAPLLRLNVRNLYGTGLEFSMYTRSYYDLTNSYQRYGGSSRFKTRIYEFQLQHDLPEDQFGYGVGRMTSRYVGGMGVFDGAHFFAREGDFTAGIMFGANVLQQSVDVNSDNTKEALFVSYTSGKDFSQHYDGTLAYIRQHVKGNLDREFLYLQNYAALSSQLSIYESSEFDLNDINNGVKSSALKLSNTFFSVNYYPVPWLSTSVGYDGTRSVYLFETMKSFSDTLFDKNFMQGFRANATVRLPYFISISSGFVIRTKKGDARDAVTMDGSARMSDILGSEIGAGVRYAKIYGVYSDGDNITFDIDRTFFYSLTTSLRYDYFSYRILTLRQDYATHTATASVNYRISRTFYSSLSADDVMDKTMNSIRIFAEIGMRF